VRYNEIFDAYMKRKAYKSPYKPFSKRDLHLMKTAFKAGFDWREWYEGHKE
jgi:hypothetical protein